MNSLFINISYKAEFSKPQKQMILDACKVHPHPRYINGMSSSTLRDTERISNKGCDKKSCNNKWYKYNGYVIDDGMSSLIITKDNMCWIFFPNKYIQQQWVKSHIFFLYPIDFVRMIVSDNFIVAKQLYSIGLLIRLLEYLMS